MHPVAILAALWLFLPAYVANMSPVFSAKIVPKWKAPIDGGRVAPDGKRLLGPGKTWRGLVGGALSGAATAWILARTASGIFEPYDFGRAQGSHDLAILAFGAWVGTMALVGDAVKSYFKRRLGKERGASWFPFDQLDFVIFGLLAFFLGSPLLADGWVRFALSDPLVLLTIIVGTLGLHLLVNRIGYHLKLKDVPW